MLKKILQMRMKSEGILYTFKRKKEKIEEEKKF